MEERSKTLEQSQQTAKSKVEEMLQQVTDARFDYFSSKLLDKAAKLEKLQNLEHDLEERKSRMSQLDKISVVKPLDDSRYADQITDERQYLASLVKDYGRETDDRKKNDIMDQFNEKLEALRQKIRTHSELQGVDNVIKIRDEIYLDLPENQDLRELKYTKPVVSSDSKGKRKGKGNPKTKVKSTCVAHHGNEVACRTDLAGCYYKPSSKQCVTKPSARKKVHVLVPSATTSESSTSGDRAGRRIKVSVPSISSKGIYFFKGSLRLYVPNPSRLELKNPITIKKILFAPNPDKPGEKLIPDDLKPSTVSIGVKEKDIIVEVFKQDMRQLVAEFILTLFFKRINSTPKLDLPKLAGRKSLAKAVKELTNAVSIKKRLIGFIGPVTGKANMKYANDSWWKNAVGSLIDSLNKSFEE